MVFSAPTFLFLFLPLVLAMHGGLPARARNTCLLVASLFFYAWGEPAYVLVMLGSIGFNYGIGLGLEPAQGSRAAVRRRAVLVVGVAGNLALLGWFKYASFLAHGLLAGLGLLGLAPAAVRGAPGGVAALGVLEIGSVHLPIGISFFTFQALSYVIDAYRGQVAPQRNPFRLALFISLFPQLIAGPIVRYSEIEAQLAHRRLRLDAFASGVRRFCVGLAKKVLIADTLAVAVDGVFAAPVSDLSAGAAWFGVTAYALQIYFDFSGYSDMAIGLGSMLGFRLPENFDVPYAARSLREFWRRWHMTLSRWFRDYLYVPLGGNRRGPARTALNLAVVFVLCGLWHGASWTFVVWGLFHGAFLALERTGFGRWLARAPRGVQHGYALLVVIVAWTFFRAVDLSHALGVLGAMFTLGDGPLMIANVASAEVLVAFAVGAGVASPLAPRLAERWRQHGGLPVSAAATAGLALLLYGVGMKLASRTYDPFIYFRF